MSGDHNQYQKPDKQCDRCGEANPAEIHTCTPKQPAWHHVDCEGECIACLIEREVLVAYGNQGLNYLLSHLFAPPQRERVQFPTMLRKMWSGGEVQAWLDENVNKEKNA